MQTLKLFSTLVFSVAVFAAAGIAHANCSDPSGVEGEIIYNSSAKMAQFCDGSVWVNMAGVAPSAGGGGGGGWTLYVDSSAVGPVISTDGTTIYVYSNSTGTIGKFTPGTSPALGAYVYFGEADCAGTPVGVNNINNIGYACTGSASCQTNAVAASPNGTASATDYRSRRSYANGTCQTYGSTQNTTLTGPVISATDRYPCYNCEGGTCVASSCTIE